MDAARLDPSLSRACEALAAASRRLAEAGLVMGTSGNASVRSGELVAVTPTGAELGGLQAADVAVVDLSGRQRHGTLGPTSELALHLGIYRRHGAGAVVHTHAPFATALGCVLDELPPIHYGLLALGGTVRVAPYATFGTRELAEATLTALDGRSAALMANHGAVAVGHDLDQAVANMRLLEWGCELYWRAASLGAPRELDAGERAAAADALAQRGQRIRGGA